MLPLETKTITTAITAIIAIPCDTKSGVILRGRYQSSNEPCQILEPAIVIRELLSTIVTVKEYIVAAVVLVGLSTVATAALVFLLSLRLRRREIDTLVKIGGSRASISGILACEIVVVICSSILLACLFTIMTAWFGSSLIQTFILG